MTPPLAHAGHWLVNLLYLAPLVVVVGALGVQALRDRRRGTGPRREPTDDPPAG
ncbi:MAG: hypothetical protein ACRDKY_06915 [Solirubrobacteraceae bacterium]